MPTTLPSTTKIEFLSTLHSIREAINFRNLIPHPFPMSLEEVLHWRSKGTKANGFIVRSPGGVMGYLGLGIRNPDNLSEMSIFSHCHPDLDLVSFQRLIDLGIQMSCRLGARRIVFNLKLSEGERMDHLLKSGFRMQTRVIQLSLPLAQSENVLYQLNQTAQGDAKVEILPLSEYIDRNSSIWKQSLIATELAILTEIRSCSADEHSTRDLIVAGLNCSDFDPKLVVVATHSDDIIGFTHAHRNAIDDLKLHQGLTGVLPPWRGNGIARSMKTKLLNEITRSGFDEIWTENSIGSSLYVVNHDLGFQDRDESWQLVKTVA